MQLGTKVQYAARGIPKTDGTFKPVTKGYLSNGRPKEFLLAAMVPDPKNPKKKLVDFQKADELFLAHADPDHQEKQIEAASSNGNGGDIFNPLTSAKTKRVLVQLENDELNLLERKRQTVFRKEVTDACALAGQKIQEQLKAMSRRVADKAATMSDAREIKTMLDEEIRKTLDAISDELERKFGEEGEGTAQSH